MTSWEEICNFLKEEECGYLIQALKTLVGDANDLALVDLDDLEIIANRGLVTKRTKVLLQRHFDDWSVISKRVQLKDIEIYKKVFEKPSLLLEVDSEFDEPEELWTVLPTSKRYISRKITTILDPQKWKRLYAVELLDEDSCKTDTESVMRQNAKKLFAQILVKRDDVYCATSETALDEKFDLSVVPGRTTTAKRLLSSGDKNAKAIDLGLGIIETLQTTVDGLMSFPQIQFVDLSENRLGSSEWSDICKILDIISKNNGALAIYGNPVARSTSDLQNLALTNIDVFFRLIWIAKQDLCNASNIIDSTLQKKVSHDVCKQIKYAHVAFFEHFARLCHSGNSCVRHMRIFRD